MFKNSAPINISGRESILYLNNCEITNSLDSGELLISEDSSIIWSDADNKSEGIYIDGNHEPPESALNSMARTCYPKVHRTPPIAPYTRPKQTTVILWCIIKDGVDSFLYNNRIHHNRENGVEIGLNYQGK
ncbi:3902_t:CDS:2, partial [Diversispora eburnea]